MQALILPSGLLHSPVYTLVFWRGAFLSLGLALIALNAFWEVIDSDSECLSLGKELVLACAASGIEGVAVWALAAFVPAALGRGILVPLIVVWVLYRIAHYESWGSYDPSMLVMLQIVIVLGAVALILGHFQLAFMIIGGCALFLAIYAAIVKSL
jgi:hypothetical protein